MGKRWHQWEWCRRGESLSLCLQNLITDLAVVECQLQKKAGFPFHVEAITHTEVVTTNYSKDDRVLRHLLEVLKMSRKEVYFRFRLFVFSHS